MNATNNTATATPVPSPASVTLSALDKARLFFLPAMWDDFTPACRDDVQAIVNAWNALGEAERTPALASEITERLAAFSQHNHDTESERLATFNGSALFAEIFGASIPATAARNESPRALMKRVIDAPISSETYRPRFKEDGTLEVRISPRLVKCADILRAKERLMRCGRPDKHAEKNDRTAAWASVFTPAIERALLTAIAYAEKANSHAQTLPALNSRTRSAVEEFTAAFDDSARNPFTLSISRTAVQDQVRAIVACILGDTDAAKAWNKRECNNLYADLYRMQRHAETIATMVEAFDAICARAHVVKYGAPVVIDGAGIHTADKSATVDPSVIR